MEVMLLIRGHKGKYTVTESHQSFYFYPLNCFYLAGLSFHAVHFCFLPFFMELLAGDCRKRAGDDFAGDVNPFDGSDGGCEWMYGSRQSGSLRPHGNDDALATLADLAPPPQKLKPIRCVVKPPSSENRHPLDILAGTLERLPEMGFLGDGCFEAPLGSKIADVEESGQLTRGFAKDDSLGDEMEFQGRISGNRTSWDGVSLR